MKMQDTGGDKQSPKTSSGDGVVSKDRGRQTQKLKWHWHWKKKENQPPQVTQFSHDPPGHTCGLPCCIQDNEPQQALQRKSQVGCVTVPILSQADLSDSNFIMKRKHVPADRQMDKVRLRRSDEFEANPASGCDGEAEDIEYIQRGIRLSKSSDGIPFTGAIGQRGEQFTNKAPDWPHHRKQHTLTPMEQMRQRHITLPDCPQTQHTIMFLSHQPGETSDFPEIRTTNAQTPRHQKVQDSTEDPESELRIFSEREFLAFKSPCDPVSPDEGYDKSDDFQDTSHRKRLVHSKLPEVPVESTDSGLAFEHEFRQVSPEIEDDDMEDSMSVYVDHVYDVPSVVKDSAYKLSQNSSGVTPGSTPDFLSPNSASDFLQPKCPVLHRSVSELTLSGIDSFTFPEQVEDNESCVYNGSLLSYATNDSEISLLYPSVIARHRYLMGQCDYSTSLLRREFFGSKLDQLSLSSTEKNERDVATQGADNVSTASITNENDAQLQGSKHWINLGLPKPSIKVDEYDMSGRLPSRSRLGVGASVSREFDLDSNTKLKLWDLRLSTTNRDHNDYSTFPLRTFPSDDVNLGYFPSRANERDNDAAIEKITNNAMPSSVLSSNIHRDNTALCFLSQYQPSSFQSPDPSFGKLNASLDEWKQQFDTNRGSTVESQPFPSISTTSGSKMPPNCWIFPWREESEHEPIIFSGIYELFKSREAAQSCVGSGNDSSKCLEYTKGDEQSAGLQRTGNGSSPNPTFAFDPDSSIYASYTYFGGSVSCSTSSFGSFANRSTACGSISPGPKMKHGSATPPSGRSEWPRRSSGSLIARTETNQDNETVIMTKGTIVDWRRQAELYRDNNFITLIL